MLARQRHKNLSVTILLGLIGPACPDFVSRAAEANSLADLRKNISEHIAQPMFSGATWGIKVVSLETGETWFEHNADKLMIPASNAKLFTGALALDRLGPEFRFRTSLLSNGHFTRSGILRGDLLIVGRGDPSFAARFNHGDYRKSLLPIYRELKASGVKRISGSIIGDESYFLGPSLGNDWAWDDLQEYYGAETSALTVDDNVVDLLITPGKREGDPCRIIAKPATTVLTFINRARTGAADSTKRIKLFRPLGENRVFVDGSLPLDGEEHSDAIAVHEPARMFVDLLERTLEERGIKVGGKTMTISWRDRINAPIRAGEFKELAVVESPPLSEITAVMMKRSQNLYAQLFLLQVGEKALRTGARDAAAPDPAFRQTSQAAGLAEMDKFLDELGIPRGDVLLREGSGLSRACLIKPSSTIRLLQQMQGREVFDAFRHSLPVAGVDGTLRWRMKNTAAEKNVRAKTGTLRHVHTLSGYVTTKSGKRLAFSIMLNHFRHPDPEASTRRELDQIAVMLAEFDR